MTILEIVLLVVGVLIFIAGFFIPEKTKNQTSWEEKKEIKRIEELVEKELQKRQGDFDEALDDKLMDALDKTERALERITNDKIMAVNEYGDTVLTDINKNHDEAVFLYSMLNDKHEDILKSQADIENKSKEVKNTLKAIEEAKTVTVTEQIVTKETKTEETNNSNEINLDLEEIKKPKKNRIRRKPESVEVSSGGNNHNDEILRLYKEGKSNVAIAKELGLGVGEVKLVIDLAKM